MRRKILCISPHLSTGGCPQYLVYKIENLIKDFDVLVVEYENVSDEYVVQKNKLLNLIGKEKLITLDDNKNKLTNIIQKFNPDIIHLEELNEYFMDINLASQIFNSNRNYLIFETSHDAGFDIKNKRFLPDRFVFVSKYQVNKFKNLNIPIELIEYPIIRQQKNKQIALNKLQLSNNKFHIINIGLFTRRKNQGELVELARRFSNESIQFHFIGNTAPNFADYWEPILKNIPSNCKIWGERHDINLFYEIADLFYFSSKGNSIDKETNPLVIRECLSYNLPILLRNIDSYEGMFDNTNNVYFISENQEINYESIKYFYNQWKLNSNFIEENNNAKNILVENNNYYLESNKEFPGNRIEFTWRGENIEDVYVSVRDKVTKLVMYSYQTSLTQHTNYWIIPIGNVCFGKLNNFKGFQIDIHKENKLFYTFDIILNHNATPPDDFTFNVNYIDPTWYNYYEFFYLQKYKDLLNIDINIAIDIGANCGTFTRFLQKQGAKTIYAIEPNKRAFYSFVNSFNHDKNVHGLNYGLGEKDTQEILYSCKNNSTLCSILKEQIDKFKANAFEHGYELDEIQIKSFESFLKENNLQNKIIDLLKIDVEGFEYNIFKSIEDYHLQNINNIIIETHHVDKKQEQLKELIDKLSKHYDLYFYQNGGDITKDPYTVIDGMGLIIGKQKIKNKIGLKLKAVHLLTLPDTEREQRSINSVKKLEKFGIQYKQNINQPYTSLPPIENCARPQDISDKPGYCKLSPGHFGNYMSHSNAILNEWEDNLDGLLIFECDAILTKPIQEFIDIIKQTYEECEKYKMRVFSYGPKYINEKTMDMGYYYITPLMYEIHAYLITKSNIKYIQDKIKTTGWDVFDMWMTANLKDQKMGVLKEPYSIQAQGFSLVDQKESVENWHGQLKV